MQRYSPEAQAPLNPKPFLSSSLILRRCDLRLGEVGHDLTLPEKSAVQGQVGFRMLEPGIFLQDFCQLSQL